VSPPVPPLVIVVEAHRIVRASREHVFAYIARPEHLPRYGAPLWLTGDVEERRGGEPLVTLRGYFAGLPVEAVVRSAARSPHSVDITQIRGTLRGFTQRFTIESGDEATLLGCRVEADPGIPLLSDEAVKHFLVQYVERMLDRVRLAAERRTPSRRPLRAARAEAGAADAAAGEADELAAADDAIPETQDADGTTEEGAALPAGPEAALPTSAPPSGPESTPREAPSRPPGPRRSPVSRTARRPFLQRPSRPTRGTVSPSSIAPAETPPSVQGTPAPGPTTPSGASAEATSSGLARRRRRRRRRRGRGGGGAAGPPIEPPAGPRPSGPQGGESTSTGSAGS
jgi:hypothetical protein